MKIKIKMITIKKTTMYIFWQSKYQNIINTNFFFLMKSGFDMSKPELANRAFYDNGNVLFCFIQYGSSWWPVGIDHLKCG